MAYEFESRVRYSETDMDRKLTMVSLANYFQDCSTFQSEGCGRGLDYLEEQKRVWMVLSWQIDILRLPLLGEKIRVQTWPYAFKDFYGMRNFALAQEDGTYLAKANSVWVFMDRESGRPCKVLPENISGYEMEPKLDMEYGSRKIRTGKDGEGADPFFVVRHHLDSNHHVNNGQYIAMAQEYLPEQFQTSRLRVEYRKQARLHDRIFPVIYQEGEKVTVSLGDGEGQAYAVVEFIQKGEEGCFA
mgnify:CR=1 FL=1